MARTKSEHSRQNILDAACSVMEEVGYIDMSIEQVACRAKAGKQTVYRHFGTKPRLALEAFLARSATEVPLCDTGTLLGDLSKYLSGVTDAMSEPHKGQMLGGLVAEVQTDPELGQRFRECIIANKGRALRTVFQRGIARGEVAADADISVLVDLVYGPIWYRMLISGEPVDASFACSLARMVAIAARGPLKSGPLGG